MRMVNTSNVTVTSDQLKVKVPPQGVVEIPDAYCTPGRSPNGGRIPSVVECLIPQLEPEDPDVRRIWREGGELPKVEAKPRVPTVQELVDVGVPQAVAETMVKAGKSALANEAKAKG